MSIIDYDYLKVLNNTNAYFSRNLEKMLSKYRSSNKKWRLVCEEIASYLKVPCEPGKILKEIQGRDLLKKLIIRQKDEALDLNQGHLTNLVNHLQDLAQNTLELEKVKSPFGVEVFEQIKEWCLEKIQIEDQPIQLSDKIIESSIDNSDLEPVRPKWVILSDLLWKTSLIGGPKGVMSTWHKNGKFVTVEWKNKSDKVFATFSSAGNQDAKDVSHLESSELAREIKSFLGISDVL